MILVTGAAGKTGRAVIRALHHRGATVRALVRSEPQIDVVEASGDLETLVGDMRDPQVWKRALSRTDAVYHICPNTSPDEIAIGVAALDASREAGVRHFVYHSVLHPQVEAMPHHWNKVRVEEKVFESRLPFTILQPAAYMQNILGYADGIAREGAYRVPYGLDTRLSMVDLEDVADVAARVLTEPGHSDAIYELSGPDTLSQKEVAAMLTKVLGRPVQASEIPVADWQQSARESGLGAYQIDALVAMFRYYGRYDFVGNPRVLETLLGRSPMPFRDFLVREREFFRLAPRPER